MFAVMFIITPESETITVEDCGAPEPALSVMADVDTATGKSVASELHVVMSGLSTLSPPMNSSVSDEPDTVAAPMRSGWSKLPRMLSRWPQQPEGFDVVQSMLMPPVPGPSSYMKRKSASSTDDVLAQLDPPPVP